MGIGSALVMITAGAILTWAVDVDLPFVDDDALGAILVLGGVLVAVAGAFQEARRSHAGTSVGTGFGLMVTGAILFWAVDLDFPYIADGALGVILMAAGAIAVAASLAMQFQDARASRAADRRLMPRDYRGS